MLRGTWRALAGPSGFETVELSVNIDTLIWEGKPTLNYGTKIVIGVGTDNTPDILRGLFSTDLSSIPSGTTIRSATLRLYIESEAAAADETIGAHRGLTQWYGGVRDGQVPGATDGSTWNQRNGNTGAPLGWGAVGGQAGVDYTAVATDSVLITATGAWYEWDVTADVQAVMDGGNNYGWWLINTDEVNNQTAKRVTASDAGSNQPELIVTY